MEPLRSALVLLAVCGCASPADSLVRVENVTGPLYSLYSPDWPVTCHGDGEFLCKHGTACIPHSLRCDDMDDCGDRSDEFPCMGSPNPNERWAHCPPSIWCDGYCISDAFICDGGRDCSDGSDEADCPPCSRGFRCGSGECVPPSRRCDGTPECPDRSDERNCTELEAQSATTCQPGQVRCSDRAGCIDAAHVCDGRPQCGDASDEGIGCGRRDTCSPTACSEKQTCLPTLAGGHICLCPDGNLPDATDYCQPEGSCVNHDCEHDCQPGSGCVCPEGLQLAGDNRTCGLAADSAEPELLLADRDTVRQLSLLSHRLHTLARAGEDRVLGVTGELSTRTIYWGYRNQGGGVYRRAVTEQAPVDAFLKSGVRAAPALAWEWVSRVLYLADVKLNHLAACDWLGHCAVLLRQLAGRPLALAVYPQERALFWAEKDNTGGRILRAGLDGDGGAALPLPDLKSPRSLAVDPAARRLYWVDSSRNVIESSLLDGSDRHQVPELMVRAPHSLVVVGQSLFWSDHYFEGVHVCNKYAGEQSTSVYRVGSAGPFRLAAMHASLQPRLPNPCADSRCSHLCLLSQNAGHRCFCAEGERLGADGLSCHPDNTD